MGGLSPHFNPPMPSPQNHSFQISKIAQLDGGDSLSNISQSDQSDNGSNYEISISSGNSEVDIDDEIDPQTTPIILTPPPQYKKSRKIIKGKAIWRDSPAK